MFTGDNLLTFQHPHYRLAGPFALWPALPAAVAGRHARDYYETSAPPHGQQSATDLPTTELAARRPGRPRAVPTFTMRSIGQGGTQLYPGSIATTTPQTFTVASPPPELDGFGVKAPDLTTEDPTHCRPAHIHQVGAGFAITEREALVRSRCTF